VARPARVSRLAPLRARQILGPTDDQKAAIRAAGVPFGHGVLHASVMLVGMERTLIVARHAQRVVLVPISSTTVPRPDGVAVDPPAGGVPIRLRPLTPSNVEPGPPF
jgi:hypothetical protein